MCTSFCRPEPLSTCNFQFILCTPIDNQQLMNNHGLYEYSTVYCKHYIIASKSGVVSKTALPIFTAITDFLTYKHKR